MKYFWRLDDITRELSVSKSSVWRLVASGKLPKGKRVLGRITLWKSADIINAIENM